MTPSKKRRRQVPPSAADLRRETHDRTRVIRSKMYVRNPRWWRGRWW
jgi:hypothetical protein